MEHLFKSVWDPQITGEFWEGIQPSKRIKYIPVLHKIWFWDHRESWLPAPKGVMISILLRSSVLYLQK